MKGKRPCGFGRGHADAPARAIERCWATNRKPITRRRPGLSFTRDTARAMSQENVEVVRTQYERLNRVGQLNQDDSAPDATFDASRILGFGIYRGLDDFLAAWVSYRDTFDQWWIEVDELLDGQGERVFAAVRD